MAEPHPDDAFALQAGSAAHRDDTSPASPSRVLASAPSGPSGSSAAPLTPTQLRLFLQRPASLQDGLDARTKEDTVVVDRDTTVAQIKSRIASTWHGKPKEEGLRLIARGRVLGDSEKMATALNAQIGDSFAHPVQVAVRPNAWTSEPVDQPKATPSNPLRWDSKEWSARSRPVPAVSIFGSSSELAAPAATSSDSSSLVDEGTVRDSAAATSPLLTYYLRMTRSQRAAFIHQVSVADVLVAGRIARLKDRIAQTRLDSLGLRHSESSTSTNDRAMAGSDDEWDIAEKSLIALLEALGLWSSGSGTSAVHAMSPKYRHFDQEYERVDIHGLPFLLYLPPTFRSDNAETSAQNASEQQSLDRLFRMASVLARIRGTISRLNQGLLDQATPLPWEAAVAPSIHHLPGFPVELDVAALPPPAVGLGMLNVADPPGQVLRIPAGPGADPRELGAPRMHRLEVVISLDTLLSYAGPLLWLSIKLAFLLYLFARNATSSKRAILVGMAVLWVIWEGWAIRAARRSERRRRQRELRGNDGGQPVRRDPVRVLLERARNPADAGEIADGPAPVGPPDAEVTPAATADFTDPVRHGQDAPSSPNLRRRSRASSSHRRPTPQDVAAMRLSIERLRSGATASTHRRSRRANRLSLRYWIVSVAATGLGHDYYDLGRRPGASRSQGAQWRRRLQAIYVGATLFLGTLLPEVERRRKKALEKRRKVMQAVAQHLDNMTKAPEQRTPSAPTSSGVGDGISPPQQTSTNPRDPPDDGPAEALNDHVDDARPDDPSDPEMEIAGLPQADVDVLPRANSPASDTDEEGGAEEGGAMMLF